ncbi:MAG: FMN-binding glutamate synthase family protein [Planctomycetota bacterium]
MSAVTIFFGISSGVFGGLILLAQFVSDAFIWVSLPLFPLFFLGVWDVTQKRKAVLRNFPVIGHFRYLFELIRPEIQQYFIESDTDGKPFNRDERSIVYQRAKAALSTRPFGTLNDLDRTGTEIVVHSLNAKEPTDHNPRTRIGEDRCEKPYDAALLNISAMSYGSLSASAIRALNGGAAIGGFFHNTGEGGISPYHLEPGGDLCWQIGTGYFGCRGERGGFDAERFRQNAIRPEVKLIEIKLSQGAKPGHGGILPAQKVTEEIAAIRNVPLGQDVLSPPQHSAFGSPVELLQFVDELRKLSGGKPVGIKLCVGRPREFLGIIKAALDTGLMFDFVSVDGAEGGTGAAPLEFANSIGLPLTEGLLVVQNALVGTNLRDQTKIIAAGKVVTGFHIVQRLAIGADLCNSARGMMFALGCIQALRCNSNHCPVGVATNNPSLERGLVVEDKRQRVASFQKHTVEAAMEILGAAGLERPDDLTPSHLFRRRSSSHFHSYEDIYDFFEPGDLLEGRLGKRDSDYDELFAREWAAAKTGVF